MKIKSARFKNLIGINRASGLDEIYIDFTKCIHNIVLISGPNGSGKSTLMNVLHPLPDSGSMYIPGKEGLKEIEYIDEDVIYRIRIIYPTVAISLSRGQTKAFLTELKPTGEEVEYNPNGNVGSFKSQLYTRFNLDPNFVSLSQLSIEDRGIVDRTPSERKKYVNLLLESTEVYNNIFKTLSKRSTIFKSMINSLTAKIDNIGDEDKLNSELASINTRLDMLKKRRDFLIKEISANESIISLTDPDNSIQNLYRELNERLELIENQAKIISPYIEKCNQTEDELYKLYKEITDELSILNTEIQNKKQSLQMVIARRDEEFQTFQLKRQRLDSLSSDTSFEEITAKIELLKANQKRYIDTFKSIGIENFAITKDEYITGINTLNQLKEMVDNMRSYNDYNAIQSAISYIRNGSNPADEINKLSNKLDLLRDNIYHIKEEIKYYEGISKTLTILDNRPKECKIDTCPFIKDALEAKSKYPNQVIQELNGELECDNIELNKLCKDMEMLKSINSIFHAIQIIIRSINNNSTILSKLPNGYIFGNLDIFLDKLEKGNHFDEIKDINKYLDYANMLELYKNEKETLIRLESEYKIYESKHEMIEEIQNDIDNLVKKLNNIGEEIESTNDYIRNKILRVQDLEEKLQTVSEFINKFTEFNKIVKEQNEIKSKIKIVYDNMSTIEKAIMNINSLNSELTNISAEIDPLSKQGDSISYSLTQLKSYKIELNEYNDKYNMVELIKKYTSPTKGGIQTLFMQLYMGKTLEIANNLLSLLFNGRMELLPYIINDTEFRIPCKSEQSSIINDDISSCSSAERSMISMIISFALLYQSSTRYNIIKLDEIDGMLDQSNRSNFIVVLNKIMEMLNVENCIIVSHSSEIELSNVDVISLYRSSDDISYNGANIIFSY